MNNKYKVSLSFLGVDQRAEVLVNASCPENAVTAVTRGAWVEVTPGVLCPTRNVTEAKVEIADKLPDGQASEESIPKVALAEGDTTLDESA